jgi:Tol biopolymer transport system component
MLLGSRHWVAVRWSLPMAAVIAAAAAAPACSSSGGGSPSADAGESPQVASGAAALAAGQWSTALSSCTAAEKSDPADCSAAYCDLIARTMQVVDEINSFLLPRYRRPLTTMPGDLTNLATTNTLLEAAEQSAENVTTRQCQFYLPTLPLLMGDKADPVLQGEVRGLWTVRDAHMLAALFYSMSYGLAAMFTPSTVPVPPPPAGETTPGLPTQLDTMRQHLLAQDQLLQSQPADVDAGRGGWLDRNGNGKQDAPDELLVDIFKPGTQDRVIDFSTATFASGTAPDAGVLTPTSQLPPARCGYQQFHVTDVVTANTLATDGMSFSPDSTKIVFPVLVSGQSQIQIANADGTGATCMTCGQPGNNDGVRWRPGPGDALIFISDRDHPYATGNAGGGFGQELYAMKTDGSMPTRLTTSDAWATNYHANWSPDGMHVVWGRTEAYAWDVMVADFVSDASGMRLQNVRTVVHDTAWWETHGFTPDGGSILTTSSQAGFQSTDLYAIDLATLARTRLTTNIAWDEHGHMSPDGREISWISARWSPASVLHLDDGTISPAFDWLWSIPGIFFEFLHPPAGFTSELTLMDADGQNIHPLTSDQLVVADNEWSPDGTKIIFRQTSNDGQTTKIRVLTFDDCH